MSTPAPPYSLAVHQRTHWQGNAPLDCPWCIGETEYRQEMVAQHQQQDQDESHPFAGAVIAVLFLATLTFAVLAFLTATTGAALNGFTFCALTSAGLFLWAAHTTTKDTTR